MGGSRYGERGKAAVYPDEPARVIVKAKWVAALWVEVGGPELMLMYQREP